MAESRGYLTRHTFHAGDLVPEWIERVRPRWPLRFVQTVDVEYRSSTRHVDVYPREPGEVVRFDDPVPVRRTMLHGAPGITCWHPLPEPERWWDADMVFRAPSTGETP